VDGPGAPVACLASERAAARPRRFGRTDPMRVSVHRAKRSPTSGNRERARHMSASLKLMRRFDRMVGHYDLIARKDVYPAPRRNSGCSDRFAD
jgi:hypothetical protein